MRKLKIVLLRQSHLSHLLITLATTLYLPTRVPYNNNINNYINATIVTYYSTTYDNNSIYFTTITLVDITISTSYNYSNV